MSKPVLRAALATALDIGKNAPHCDCADVASQLQPILTLATDLKLEIASRRQALLTAQFDDASSDGHTDRLHQTVDALDKDADELIRIGRRVRLGMLQWDRYADEIRAEYVVVSEMTEPPNPTLGL